jgi:hypothetical protein
MVKVTVALRKSKHEPRSAKSQVNTTQTKYFQNNALGNAHTTSYHIGHRESQRPFIHVQPYWWFCSMTRLHNSSNMSPALDTKAWASLSRSMPSTDGVFVSFRGADSRTCRDDSGRQHRNVFDSSNKQVLTAITSC